MIIAIANQKGGCAKTTTAINLAASLAARGRRTLLIDLDPQTHASTGLGVKADHLDLSMYNVLSDRTDQRQFIESIILPYSPQFDLAPGHVLLSTIEQEYVDKNQAISKLKSVIENMVFPYEFTIIDCPPSLGFLTFNALYASDLTVVPVELGSFSLLGVAKVLSMIELIRVKMNYAPKVLTLASMVDLRSRFTRNMLEHMREMFKTNLFNTFIRANIACKESQHLGVPVLFHDERSKAAQDYLALADELLAACLENRMVLEASPAAAEWVDPRPRVRDFLIKSPEANGVYLVGDFNHWKMDDTSRLWDAGEGLWQKRLLLTPGRYRYKFVVDGKWVPDPGNKLAEPNPYGGIDSVIEIE